MSNSPVDIPTLLERSFATDILILHEDELGVEFFRLEEGLLGELFQKFVNYDSKAALIVKDERKYSPRVRELIYEHRTHPNIRFFRSEQEANAWIQEIKQADD